MSQVLQHAKSFRLRDSSLWREQAYLAGDWADADGKGRLAVTNPADGRELGWVPNMGQAETERAIEAAASAYPAWRAMLAKDRGAILQRWGELMMENQEDLAVIMTLEQGKPVWESRGEIAYAASFLTWFAAEAERAYGDTIPTHLEGRKLFAQREPVGVTAAITPWNFPSAMITRKAGAALAAGCPMVVRPATETPYSALALGELATRAGVPKGVLSILTGSARRIGQVLCDSTTVRKISFTGSTEVGRILLAQSAETVKKVSMELGGHAPFLVFEDADLDLAVDGAMNGKFQTTGQDCLAVNRFYIHERLYDSFAERFAAQVKQLKVGNGLEGDVDQGPLMNEGAVEKCEAHIKDAVDKGAVVLAGGGRHELGGLFFQPTVLGNVTPDMAIAKEETFGPVAALMKFSDEDEVLRQANSVEFGLASYVYTENYRRIWRVSDALEYGMVGVNCSKITGAPIPFGGVKQSGLGREGSKYGIDDYTELKYVCLGGLDR
ncbi:NAD-dependent succinate-semialdehyde dehydrogenase [Ferruginivarius sediminum]|uniref:NAD-dependent succinate-semialdehyde dehydrogenase n=1 Tax=Ferruginivarius sediminum TaxID=2661937 RepID=A0A369TCE5_9PROT|nr:NAD-dependent succinate-semialdehyde dehydrogenase [Ferruginivarius sediminum]RDD61837.1 NAD-dependent succinate-semialdehyde dehydrogenase [Ferruginivarius sediminum]